MSKDFIVVVLSPEGVLIAAFSMIFTVAFCVAAMAIADWRERRSLARRKREMVMRPRRRAEITRPEDAARWVP